MGSFAHPLKHLSLLSVSKCLVLHLLNLNGFFCSGRSDGAGVEGRHCESHDYKAAAVLVENGPHHCGSDEQGECLYILVSMLI